MASVIEYVERGEGTAFVGGGEDTKPLTLSMAELSYEVELRSKTEMGERKRKQILKPGTFNGDFQGGKVRHERVWGGGVHTVVLLNNLSGHSWQESA